MSGSSSARATSTPMRRIRSACCARAASGHAAAAPPSSVMNSRRFIAKSLHASAGRITHLGTAGDAALRDFDPAKPGPLVQRPNVFLSPAADMPPIGSGQMCAQAVMPLPPSRVVDVA